MLSAPQRLMCTMCKTNQRNLASAQRIGPNDMQPNEKQKPILFSYKRMTWTKKEIDIHMQYDRRKVHTSCSNYLSNY